MRQLTRSNGETKMCKYTVRLSERADSKPLATTKHDYLPYSQRQEMLVNLAQRRTKLGVRILYKYSQLSFDYGSRDKSWRNARRDAVKAVRKLLATTAVADCTDCTGGCTRTRTATVWAPSSPSKKCTEHKNQCNARNCTNLGNFTLRRDVRTIVSGGDLPQRASRRICGWRAAVQMASAAKAFLFLAALTTKSVGKLHGRSRQRL